jgi:hypothetical protein
VMNVKRDYPASRLPNANQAEAAIDLHVALTPKRDLPRLHFRRGRIAH